MNSCIYKITNKINGKIYIGQTVNLENRLKEHFSKQNCTGKKFRNAINKYGKENFEYEVLEWVESDKLNEREQYYLDLYQPFDDKGYNLQRYSEKSNLGAKWSDEVKQKISKGVKEYYKNNDNPFKGRTHTEETKQKMSESLKGRTHTEETKQKMRESNIKNNNGEILKQWISENGHPRFRKIVKLDKNTGEYICQYDSTKEASEKCNIGKTSITNCLRGYSKSGGGFLWMYLEDFNK